MNQAQTTTDDPRRGLYLGICLGVLTLLVYGRTLAYPFVNYDDPAYVVQNPHVQTGLTLDNIRWAFTTFDCGNWHPLTWLSLQLDGSLFGGQNASGFHFTNVLLHLANTLLLFFVFTRMTGGLWQSALVAALFALHPLHVESVAWVAERKDVLSTLFWMLTLAAYWHHVQKPSLVRYLLVMLALALGLLAKPMLVTLPCVLLLLDVWPLQRRQRGPWRLLLEKAPLFVLVLLSCLVTLSAQSQGQAVASLEAFPLSARLANAMLAYVTYLGKMVWPLHLAVYYPHPGPSVPMAQGIAAGVLLIVLTVLVLGPGRRRPYLAVGWFWYLGTLVPVIGLVQVGGQALADRYTYVPFIGLFLALTWGASDLATAWRLPRAYLVAGAVAVVSACAVRAWFQVEYWDSNLHLWERAAAVSPHSALAHINLGSCYYEQHRTAAAEKEFEKALAIDPNIAEAHVNLGNVLSDLQQWQKAESEYRTAMERSPEFAGAHFGLGSLLVKLGRHDEALKEYQQAIRLDPNNPRFPDDLGNLCWELGRLKEAEAAYRTALALNPASAQSHLNLGGVLAEMGRYDEAETEFKQAIALEPLVPHAHRSLGNLLWQLGRFDASAEEFREAMELGDEQGRSRLRACERMRSLLPRLAAVIAGRDRPTANAERLAFAELCRQPFSRQYAVAARLYREAFDADPSATTGRQMLNRFHAACAAAAAGCGQGRDVSQPDEKAQLRRQALAWLQADLDLWSKQAQSEQMPARAAAGQTLRFWRRNAELAGVRDAVELAKLPESERQDWQKFWQKVDAAESLTRAVGPSASQPRGSGNLPR